MEKANTVVQLLKTDVTSKDTRCNYEEVDFGMDANKALASAGFTGGDREFMASGKASHRTIF